MSNSWGMSSNVLRAGGAVIGSHLPDCLPTGHLGGGGLVSDGDRRGQAVSVMTVSFPWGTTSLHSCCSTPAATCDRLERRQERKASEQQNFTAVAPISRETAGQLQLWRRLQTPEPVGLEPPPSLHGSSWWKGHRAADDAAAWKTKRLFCSDLSGNHANSLSRGD